MKLITKTSYYYIIFSIIGFIIGGYIFYHITFTIINNRTNDDLKTDMELIEEQIFSSDSLPDFTPYFGHQIVVTIYNKKINPSFSLRDTMMYDTTLKKMSPFRHQVFTTNKNGKSYMIEIFQPLMDTFQLIEDIVLVMFIMFTFLLLSLILTNYYVSRNTWFPFYHTLKQIRDYDINNENGLNFTKTNITEFKQLNDVVLHMSNKIFYNYISLKEFTENASHEIQTPLAIVKSKLELLIQSQSFSDDQMNMIQSMFSAINRLSKLNSNLVLLSKIENSQFHDIQRLNLNKIIESTIINYEDLIYKKELTLQKNITASTVEIEINPTLAEVLITNLISNAVKHNIQKGKINIILNHQMLCISNTGLPLEKDPWLMFDRFKKSNTNSDSLGLGLSIVQKIANLYHMPISYTYESEIHTLTITFVKP